ncbi:hypothetical protein F5141DRAFT_355095 [Pisolithus sp. B1]|nr:hypothetical protein F5141DRAFT_355095 [Pisolithus sp. B1]
MCRIDRRDQLRQRGRYWVDRYVYGTPAKRNQYSLRRYAMAFTKSSPPPRVSSEAPRWITSIACLRYSDIFVSGSWDGEIRMWKLDPKLKSFSLVGTVEVPGVVNSLQLLSVPKGGLDGATWAQNTPVSTDKTVKITGVESILLVAGIGPRAPTRAVVKCEGGCVELDGRDGVFPADSIARHHVLGLGFICM